MKQIALTFDDGPDPTTTPVILAALKKFHAHATFMLWGEHVQAHPELVWDELTADHALGNHTFSHRSLLGLPAETIEAELAETDRAVQEAVGAKPTFFRPPYGDIDRAVARAAQRPAVTWHVDSEDWLSHDANLVEQRVTTLAHDGDIVLMHDIQPATAQAIGPILEALTAADFEFVTVPALFAGKLQAGYLYQARDIVKQIENEGD